MGTSSRRRQRGDRIRGHPVRRRRRRSRAETVVGAVTGASIGGLVDGRTYTFTVTAINANGAGVASQPTSPITVGTPDPPARITRASGAGSTAVIQMGPPAATNGSSVTGYLITPYLGPAPQAPITLPGTARAATVTTLDERATYQFTVAAVNHNGAGAAVGAVRGHPDEIAVRREQYAAFGNRVAFPRVGRR